MPAFLRLDAVKQRTGVSRATIYRWIDEGIFPLPRKIGPKAVAWDSDAIEAWAKACPVVYAPRCKQVGDAR